MAGAGWKLKSVKRWRFSFVKCQRSVRRYFMYLSLDAGNGFVDEFSLGMPSINTTAHSGGNKCV